MGSFEPMINLLVLLTIFSVIAERVTNILKLGKEELRTRGTSEDAERRREQSIQARSVVVGIVIALIAKADIFTMLSNLDEPWRTLGWVRVSGAQWFRSPATASVGTLLYTLGGCALTGFALGFGSKFWHDILGSVFELRDKARRGRIDPASRSNLSKGAADHA